MYAVDISKRIHIGIVSHCDVYALRKYLFEEDSQKITKTPNYATSVTNIVQGLLNEGLKVTLFTLSKDLNSGLYKGPNINIHIIQSFNAYPWKYIIGNIIDAINVRKEIKKHLSEFDLLHAHWTYEYAWAAGGFVNQLPVLCSIRDIAGYIWRTKSIKDKITWSVKLIINNIVLSNNKIEFISNSEYTATEILQRWNISSDIIPNSVKDSFINNKIENNNKDIFSIVSITQNIDQRKNILTLLKAFKEFRKSKNTELLLIGGCFDESNPVINKWKSQGLLEGVRLVGELSNNEVIEVMRKCSLMVHPSFEETFGNTIIEAMALKIPVIGGIESGAVPSILGRGEFGLLANVKSHEDIKEKMEYVFNNVEVINEIVKKAYNKVISTYSIKSVIRSHIDKYHRTLNLNVQNI